MAQHYKPLCGHDHRVPHYQRLIWPYFNLPLSILEKVAEMEEGPGGGERYRRMRIRAEEVMSEFKTVDRTLSLVDPQ